MPEKTPIEKFWMVYGLGRGAPRAMHATREKAATEASRLATVYPGETFVVLAAVDAFETATPIPYRIPVIRPQKSAPDLRSDRDEIPF